jgi:heptosyltransferase I
MTKEYVYIRKKHLLFLITVIDALGALLLWPFKIFNPFQKQGTITRILLIRLDHMGDVILSTVALRPLREAFPHASIDFIAGRWAIDVVRYNTCIDNAIEFNPSWFDRDRPYNVFDQLSDILALAAIIRKGRYDAAIDFRGDLRHNIALFLSGVKCRIGYSGINGGEFLLSHKFVHRKGIHETEHNLELLEALGISQHTARIDIPFGDGSRERIKANGITEPYAVFHAAAGEADKLWDNRKFAGLIDYISEKGKLTGVLVGSGKDYRIIREIVSLTKAGALDFSGKTDFQSLAELIRRASLFIGVDSGPAHIAAAFDIPSVVIFSGVNDLSQWKPLGRRVGIVYPGKGRDLSAVSLIDVRRVVDEVLLQVKNFSRRRDGRDTVHRRQ